MKILGMLLAAIGTILISNAAMRVACLLNHPAIQVGCIGVHMVIFGVVAILWFKDKKEENHD